MARFATIGDLSTHSMRAAKNREQSRRANEKQLRSPKKDLTYYENSMVGAFTRRFLQYEPEERGEIREAILRWLPRMQYRRLYDPAYSLLRKVGLIEKTEAGIYIALPAVNAAVLKAMEEPAPAETA